MAWSRQSFEAEVDFLEQRISVAFFCFTIHSFVVRGCVRFVFLRRALKIAVLEGKKYIIYKMCVNIVLGRKNCECELIESSNDVVPFIVVACCYTRLVGSPIGLILNFD